MALIGERPVLDVPQPLGVGAREADAAHGTPRVDVELPGEQTSSAPRLE
jgi:hypothetical protein